MEEENRRENVADALRPVLREGESFNVYCHEGEVWVDGVDTSVVAARHPRLYGRLLALNAELDHAGSGIAQLPVLLVLTFCVGLHLHWFDDLIGPFAEKLNSIWFFGLVLLALFQFLHAVNGFFERAVYRQGRDELLSQLATEQIDRDTLLALIEGDAAVARVAGHLKLDDAAGGPTDKVTR
jgi:hypothetical protein